MKVRGKKRAKELKKGEVQKIKELLHSFKTIGIARVRGIGAKRLQETRKDFMDTARLKVSKNSLISISLREDKKEEAVPFVEDQTMLIFTDLDAFSLNKLIKSKKKPAPIKAGAFAPIDITVEKGVTSLKPGPIVGELQNIGIEAGIESGKVVIKKDKVVVKEGEKVPSKVAEILAKLELYPVEEGLELSAVYDNEEKILLTKEHLQIDYQKCFTDVVEASKNAFSFAFFLKDKYPTPYTATTLLSEAARKAFSLSFNIAYPTPLTIKHLLSLAYSNARNLSISANIYERDTIPFLLKKAYLRAKSLSHRCNL